MNVSDAVSERKSIRAFLDTPVSNEQLEELLSRSARAPSGGNLQPWRVYVLNGERIGELRSFLAEGSIKDSPEYAIYPPELKAPYRDSRFKVGEDMYALLGIPREDKKARFAHLARNYEFFDAPAAFFCFVDRQMGPPQWSDLGMFLQTFMLLAVEAGLATCAQEAWAVRAQSVASFVGAPDDQMLFCGMAIGHPDPSAKVNELVSERAPISQWATFL